MKEYAQFFPIFLFLVCSSTFGENATQERWEMELEIIRGWSGSRAVIAASSQGDLKVMNASEGWSCGSIRTEDVRRLGKSGYSLYQSVGGTSQVWGKPVFDADEAILEIRWPQSGKDIEIRIRPFSQPLASDVPRSVETLISILLGLKDVATDSC